MTNTIFKSLALGAVIALFIYSVALNLTLYHAVHQPHATFEVKDPVAKALLTQIVPGERGCYVAP